MDFLPSPTESEPELILPLWRTILPPIEAGEWTPTPEYNYTSYQFLSVRTKLQSLISQRWGYQYRVKLYSVQYRGKMHLKAQIEVGTQPLDLELNYRKEVASMIEEIMLEPLEKLVILPRGDLKDQETILPSYWVNPILYYLPQLLQLEFEEKKVSLEATSYGVEAKLDLEPEYSYRNLYSQKYYRRYVHAQEVVSRKVISLYRKGYLVTTDSELIRNWELAPVKGDLHRAQSSLPEITDPWEGIVPFLLSRYRLNYLQINLGESKSLRHYLAASLSREFPSKDSLEFWFGDHWLYLKINNLPDARKVINILRKYSKNPETILRFQTPRKYSPKELSQIETSYDLVGYWEYSLVGLVPTISIKIDSKDSPHAYYLANQIKEKLVK